MKLLTEQGALDLLRELEAVQVEVDEDGDVRADFGPDRGEYIRVHAYSGRGMYGAYCLGVTFGPYQKHRVSEVAELLSELLDEDLSEPSLDSMGLGIVAYWRGVKFDVPDYLED